MKQSELNHILNQHKLWLMSNGSQGERADLSGAKLTGADLTGANFEHANLTNANLTCSILNSKQMFNAKVDHSQLSWLATDPNFCDWMNKLTIYD